MKINILVNKEIVGYKPSIDLHLQSVFGSGAALAVNDELVCAVIVEHQSEVVGFGVAYQREMFQNGRCFRGGILGGLAVREGQRGKGLGKTIVAHLDSCLIEQGVQHAFLFAYEPKTYVSSGYQPLNVPIHYFDRQAGEWAEYVFRGGMVKPYSDTPLEEKQRIEFQGCVY